MGYGNLIRSLRVEKEMTLRELSIRTDIDVAYLSRVERETCNPPQDEELLDSINVALNLDSETSLSLKDQSATDNKRYPADVAASVSRIEGFPLFLRTVSNKKLSTKQLKELTDFINERF